jgi:hypothetical protein
MPFLKGGGGGGGGGTDHASLTNLSWIVSGHTGTAGSLATFDGAGAASLLSGVQEGDIVYYDGSSWTRLAPGTPGEFLQTQGVGASPTWSEAVIGPSGATNDAVARFDGTSGSLIDNSLVTIDDLGVLNAPEVSTDLISLTNQAPSAAGQIGMELASGRPQFFVYSTVTNAAVEEEVGNGGPVTSSNVNVPIGPGFGDQLYRMNATAGPLTVTLPTLSALTVERRIVRVQKSDATGNAVQIVASGPDTINGGTDVTLRGQFEIVEIQADPANNEWVITNFFGGTIVRSDSVGADVIGSSGSPATFSTAFTAQAGFTDVVDYRTASWFVWITNKGTAARVDVQIEWSEDTSNLLAQGTEAISSGTSTLSVYEAQYDISALTAPFGLPVIVLPIPAPNAKVKVKVDAGTTTQGYVRVTRQV